MEVGLVGNAAAGSFTIDLGSSATLSGTVTAASVVDNGLMLISADGISNLVGTLAGTGHIDIESGASLTINSVAAIAPTISFHGSGTLVLSGTDLDSSLTFSPVISSLDATDQIDFSGTVTAAYWNAGILTLENGSTPVGYLHLSGNYASETFTVTMNGGVSQIVDPPGAIQSIADGAVLHLSGPTADKVEFESGKGALVLDQPASFQGQIIGLAGDILTLRGFDANHTTIHALYNAINDTTQLSVADSSDHHSVSLILDGNYSSMSMSASADQGGALISKSHLIQLQLSPAKHWSSIELQVKRLNFPPVRAR